MIVMLRVPVTYQRTNMMSQVKFSGDPAFINCGYVSLVVALQEAP